MIMIEPIIYDVYVEHVRVFKPELTEPVKTRNLVATPKHNPFVRWNLILDTRGRKLVDHKSLDLIAAVMTKDYLTRWHRAGSPHYELELDSKWPSSSSRITLKGDVRTEIVNERLSTSNLTYLTRSVRDLLYEPYQRAVENLVKV